ncbi:guanine deaminase [Lentilactobacillus farraginis DSM 18382 = JCM 14108]|uniref:Guanine deaminase n=2 Tax=Lentilactobacillus farraginis TaxID=390841 RepID=X0PFD8_9LACO|nr:nucleoside deaminase [Lentilactobacillus farraginis]KRM11034.1 guanine deaminase [Lentilactobacillus farraginis DSM 18382 = JCM 14108]GAF35562.1 guanine deaminase [Lentilactobacillus farraginis DSM 18382 = JCM 14108]
MDTKKIDQYMSLAAKEAESNLKTEAGGPFGAVIANEQGVLVTAHNQVLADQDPTAHAEITAIRKATKKLGTYDLSGYTLYTSCYPCPMCLGAIIWSNIKVAYYGNTAKDAAKIGFRDDYIYNFIKGNGTDKTVLDLKSSNRDHTIKAFNQFEDRKTKVIY